MQKNRKIDNSADELRHLRSDAYSAEQVILTKQQFSDGGACLHCYRKIYWRNFEGKGGKNIFNPPPYLP